MVSYLVNFVHCGDPNGDGLPSWEKAGSNVIILGEKAPKMGKPSTVKLTFTMLTNKAVGE